MKKKINSNDQEDFKEDPRQLEHFENQIKYLKKRIESAKPEIKKSLISELNKIEQEYEQKKKNENIKKESAMERIKELASRSKGKGWHGESERHSEDRKGGKKDMMQENNDQKINDVQDTVDLKDLRADLETKLGDGKLWEDEGKYYYKPDSDKILYEVDFDTSNIIKQEDFITNGEESDSDDSRTQSRTDSVNDESCPLLKNKNKKSASNMKKIEKQTDVYSEEEDKKKSMADEEDEDEKKKMKDTVKEEAKKEDMKKETIPPVEPPKIPTIEDFAPLIEELVEKRVNEITKDLQEEQERIKKAKIAELQDLLKKEPYGYATEDLDGKCVKDLETMKTIVERSKLYKDFQEAQRKVEDPMDINKEIFDSADLEVPTSDPWHSFKATRGGK